jgi:hypothetical protein
VFAGVLALGAGAGAVPGGGLTGGGRAPFGLSYSGRLARGRAPDRLSTGLAVRGAHVRGEVERRTSVVFGQVVRQAVEAVLSVVSLTDLVRRHVDLDALAREIDVGAVVDRVDIDALAA